MAVYEIAIVGEGRIERSPIDCTTLRDASRTLFDMAEELSVTDLPERASVERLDLLEAGTLLISVRLVPGESLSGKAARRSPPTC